MLGERIKRLRIKAGLSQPELGDKLGVSQQLISYYELGTRKPANDMLVAIANVLNCTTDYLLGREQTA